MLTDRIHALEERRDALKSQLENERARPYWDERKIAGIKHKKLCLKDEITALQHMAERHS